MDAAYPSMIAHYLYKLGLVHGHAKIQYTLLSMVSLYRGDRADAKNLPVGIFEIMQGYMKYASTFNVGDRPTSWALALMFAGGGIGILIKKRCII